MSALPLEDGDLERVEELAAIGDLNVASALDRLPANERDAVRARVIDERDYRDIADELECSESVVRQRVSRGLARVRTRLSTKRDAVG
jgi:RNA polymerase sigma-70 factor (ECF subfamily)